ncbi:hypothetical protein [Aquimarina agarivorans]|uniref:hypothetical protein n=1 Tax=Aquimarina agarivorans TaxID=980584 RepID=UPI000248F2D9|nr:hypothetical protein [Aquimarina agarivorans]
MKKFILFTLATMLINFGILASNSKYYASNNVPFVFVESGIEFAVFKNGQFDFNVIQPNVGIQINTRNINFSFNSGHNYDAFVQYDHYGAVVQIENTPVYYDYYGRVNRIGDIRLYYNQIGLAYRIGNLNISYTNYGVFDHCSGYVNAYNINYGYRPHHRYYRVPPANHCIVYGNPYRQFYNPNRCSYTTHQRSYYPGYYTRPYKFRSYRKPGTRIASTHYYGKDLNTRYTDKRYQNKNYYYSNRTNSGKTRNNTIRRPVANTRTYTPKTNISNRSYTPRTTSKNNTRTYIPRSNSSNRNYTTNSRSQSSRVYTSRAQNNSNSAYRKTTQNKKVVASTRTSGGAYRRR